MLLAALLIIPADVGFCMVQERFVAEATNDQPIYSIDRVLPQFWVNATRALGSPDWASRQLAMDVFREKYADPMSVRALCWALMPEWGDAEVNANARTLLSELHVCMSCLGSGLCYACNGVGLVPDSTTENGFWYCSECTRWRWDDRRKCSDCEGTGRGVGSE